MIKPGLWKLLLIAMFGLSPIILSSIVQAQQTQAFERGSLARIVDQHSGAPFVVSYWSIDCPPCFKELAMWSRLSQQYPSLSIVLISTDGWEMRHTVTESLSELSVSNLESWLYTEKNSDKLRFEIDPKWYGELPRTYFYDAAGEAKGVSGLIQQTKVEAWIKQHQEDL